LINRNDYANLGMDKQSKIRIDKWLWAVRVYKTRTLASEACNSGKVKINGKSVKPSRLIVIDEEITVQKKLIKHRYKVLGLIEKRVSAKIASKSVENLTPESETIKLTIAKKQPIAHRNRGKGRPTKRERRQMDKLKWE